MTTRFGYGVAAALILGQVACISIPIPGGTREEPGYAGGRRPTSRSADPSGGPALASKPVIGKEPPHKLLARDGTSCVVSRDKFERVSIGAPVLCVWDASNR